MTDVVVQDPHWPLWGWGAFLGVLKIAGGLLFVSAVIVYFVRPAPIGELEHFLIFDAPPGSWLVIAGFLGLLPTGIDVSLQASEWGKAKRTGMARIRDRLEAAGLAPTFDPFSPRTSDLSVDVRGLPKRAVEYSRRWPASWRRSSSV